MPKRRTKRNTPDPTVRQGGAPLHQPLVNNLVHVFVDDQNLFWGIVNDQRGISFRIDFGQLLIEVCKNQQGVSRGVRSAYIAGVIPDDDTFWQIAENQGFTVRRGYLGSNSRSKQDDAYLITDLTATLYEQEGPSTIVLVAGDADYVPPLTKSLRCRAYYAVVHAVLWHFVLARGSRAHQDPWPCREIDCGAVEVR